MGRVPLRHLLFLSITWSAIPPSPSHKHITGINHAAARRGAALRDKAALPRKEETSGEEGSEEALPGDEINSLFEAVFGKIEPRRTQKSPYFLFVRANAQLARMLIVRGACRSSGESSVSQPCFGTQQTNQADDPQSINWPTPVT